MNLGELSMEMVFKGEKLDEITENMNTDNWGRYRD